MELTDEFDVYMDSVNRRVSLKLMLGESSIAVGKQHIIITPQNLPELSYDKNIVKILRLADPERNEGALAAQ